MEYENNSRANNVFESYGEKTLHRKSLMHLNSIHHILLKWIKTHVVIMVNGLYTKYCPNISAQVKTKSNKLKYCKYGHHEFPEIGKKINQCRQ